ncbi:glycosyltransferase family 2 protein [Myroides odoratimimus]|uniref:glycosyltransferase family 2 protein n=1 Tax=Myroides odoratimimus TaxID=76832 RepID=UPI003D2F521F
MMKISVVIPMYNSSETIIRSLESVINQSCQECEYEVLIVNDGSKDNSVSLVEEFIQDNNKGNYVFKLINQENGGVSKARNTGLKNSTGEFIAFLDSDDEWHNDKILLQIALFKNSKVDFIATAFEEVFMNNKEVGILVPIYLKDLIYKNYFQPSTVIMRASIVDVIGFFDENQRYAEEGNYFFRVSYKFNCFFYNRKLLNYGDGKSGFGVSGLSANLKEMEKGELKNLKYAYKQNMISCTQYYTAVVFSVAKYFRRIIIVKLR